MSSTSENGDWMMSTSCIDSPSVEESSSGHVAGGSHVDVCRRDNIGGICQEAGRGELECCPEALRTFPLW